MGFSNFEGAEFKFGAPDSNQPLADQLAAWAREASAAGRVPCVYLTASWCPPSVKLEKSLGHPLMVKALRGVNFATYDIDDAGNALAAAGFPAHTVPVFFLLGPDGKRTGPTITGGAWGENTPENMAPPLERFFDAVRTEVPVSVPSAVSSLPNPETIAQMMAAAAPARAEVTSQPVPAALPAQPSAPVASSKMPMVLVAVVILIALAIAFFGK